MILLFSDAAASRQIAVFAWIVVVAALALFILSIHTLRNFENAQTWFALGNFIVFAAYFLLLNPFGDNHGDGAGNKDILIIFMVIQSFAALMIAVIISGVSKPKIK